MMWQKAVNEIPYTYYLHPGGMKFLGAHTLEVSPTITKENRYWRYIDQGNVARLIQPDLYLMYLQMQHCYFIQTKFPSVLINYFAVNTTVSVSVNRLSPSS